MGLVYQATCRLHHSTGSKVFNLCGRILKIALFFCHSSFPACALSVTHSCSQLTRAHSVLYFNKAVNILKSPGEMFSALLCHAGPYSSITGSPAELNGSRNDEEYGCNPTFVHSVGCNGRGALKKQIIIFFKNTYLYFRFFIRFFKKNVSIYIQTDTCSG